MRRKTFPLTGSALLGLLLAASGFAQDASSVRIPGHRHWRECLSILDLNDQQKAEIKGILEAAKPAVEADVAAVRDARQTFRAALEVVPPDGCAIGSHALAVKAAVGTLRAEREAVRAQIVATLDPDQASRFEGCLDAPRLDAAAADETGD